MARFYRSGWLLRCAAWAAVWMTPAWLTAADGKRDKPLSKGDSQVRTVEIFSAIEKDQIEVQLIPRSSRQCRLLIENKTDQPLSVQLPAAFAGVPVLAQQFFQQPPVNQQPINNQRNIGPQQIGIGPGFPPMGRGIFNVPLNQRFPNQGLPNQGLPNRAGGPHMFPFPGGVFNVPPEKVGKFKMPAVCLEYGKPEPRPKYKYRIEPIEDVTDKPGVAEVCAMLGQGKISQRVAQLAAWHLNNDMSWRQLADLRRRVANGTEPLYTQAELRAGKQAAESAVELAEKRKRPSTGKKGSLSRS